MTNPEEDLVEIRKGNRELEEAGKNFIRKCLAGGLNEEQYSLLIPPGDTPKKWRYQRFSCLLPGNEEFQNPGDYFTSQLSVLGGETKDLKEPKPKFQVDYSLRDYVLDSKWKNTYQTALKFPISYRC